MAQVSSSSSYLHLHHDVDDETLTLDSLPYWSHPDFDIYDSDPEFSPSSNRHGQSALLFHDNASESDSLVANSPDLFDRRENQVNFVMDLFQQRVEQSQVIGGGGSGSGDSTATFLVSDPLNGSGFGVIEGNSDIGIDHLDLDFGLGLGFGVLNICERNENDRNGRGNNVEDHHDDDSVNNNHCCGFAIADIDNIDDDDFFIGRRVSGEVGSSGVRVIGFGSDSDSDNENENEIALGDLGLRSGDEYVNEDDHDDETSIPLCWDSLQLEENRDTNEDFEWEEVDGRVDEREILSMFIDENDDEHSVSLSISPIIAPEDVVSVERIGRFENLEWEVLLNANNLETSLEMDNNNNETYFGDHDDFFHTAEYEMLFGQFAENENAWVGRPPASKSVVENLPLVVLTQEDVESNNAVCAVCKDDISVGEKVKQLPCAHWYHWDCIVPWLGIRNTCPVCRYELPTDDASYERRRLQRARRGL